MERNAEDRLFKRIFNTDPPDQLNDILRAHYARFKKQSDEPEPVIQAHEDYGGWGYHCGYGIRQYSPGKKMLLVRGVRSFHVQHEFNRIRSCIPYAIYVLITYSNNVMIEDFSNKLFQINGGLFGGVVGFLKVRSGKFLTKEEWSTEEFKDEDEIIAVYCKGDSSESAWNDKLFPKYKDLKRPAGYLPTPRQQGKGGLSSRICKVEIKSQFGPDPLYLHQLVPEAAQWRKIFSIWLSSART